MPSKWKPFLDLICNPKRYNTSTFFSVRALSKPLRSSLVSIQAGDDGTHTGFQHFGIVNASLAIAAGISVSLIDNRSAHCEGVSIASDERLQTSALSELCSSVKRTSDRLRRQIFFRYERRIRAYSSPQKVFAYFASVRDSKNQFYMTPGDLMRAFIPVFPPSESTVMRTGFLVGERVHGELHCAPSKFFMMFDANEDGLISFEEYNFLRTLIVTSLDDFFATFKMLDRNGDGIIDLKEFIKAMELIRGRKKGQFIHESAQIDTRRLLELPRNVCLLKYLFGEAGDRVLHVDDFVDFLRQLHYEILRLEFSHYDVKHQGSIPAQDFGFSMVASASMLRVNKYLKRANSLADHPSFKGVRISHKDFEQFSKLRRNRKLLAISASAVDDGIDSFSKEDFQWAASQVCQVDLSKQAVDVIFYIFDSNGDGRLSLNEFLGVQDSRELGPLDPLQPGIVHFIRCMWRCLKNNCSSLAP